MNVFTQVITNKCIYVPVAIWVIVQVMKIVIEYIKTKKIMLILIMKKRKLKVYLYIIVSQMK